MSHYGFVRIVNEILPEPLFRKGVTLIYNGDGYPEEIIPILEKAFKKSKKADAFPFPAGLATFICAESINGRNFMEVHSIEDELNAACTFYYRLSSYLQSDQSREGNKLKNWYLEVLASPLSYLDYLSEEEERKSEEFHTQYNLQKPEYGINRFVDLNLKRFLRETKGFDSESFFKDPSVDKLVTLLPKLTLEEHVRRTNQDQYGILSDSPDYSNC